MKGKLTLAEVIILAILTITAIIVFYSLTRRHRIKANEIAIIKKLHSLTSSQAQFQSNSELDQDGDEIGEYGLLGELSGLHRYRELYSQPVNPTYIDRSFRPYKGICQVHGYHVRVFLPGVKIITDTGKPLNPEPKNANAQELYWRGYAWPEKRTQTGNKIFAIDSEADLFFANNTVAKYSGHNNKNITSDTAGDKLLKNPLKNGTFYGEYWTNIGWGEEKIIHTLFK